MRSAWITAARVWILLMALQLFALLTAGVFWAGETFIQLSLWRFSPHAKLLAVSGIAVWVLRSRGLFLALALLWAPTLTDIVLWLFNLMPPSYVGRHVIASLALSVVGSSALGGREWITAGRHPRLLEVTAGVSAFGLVVLLGGVGKLPLPLQGSTDAQVLEAADWARHSTTNGEALFLFPPDASGFSLHAGRGQVVSFKLVPQLSGELIEWDQRLRDVLDVPDLSVYAAGVIGYRRSQEAMRRRYDELSAGHLFAVARRYGARYVYRSVEDEPTPSDAAVVWRGADGAVLYDLHSESLKPR